MYLSKNHLIAVLKSYLKPYIGINNNMSLINKLKTRGRSIERYGTPATIVCAVLALLLNATFCLLLFK